MKERPIIFSAPMVRAILDGTKTQTRRVVKPQPPEGQRIDTCHYNETGWAYWYLGSGLDSGSCRCNNVRGPYGHSGDRLWVKENHILSPANFADRDLDLYNVTDPDGNGRICQYTATSPDTSTPVKDYGLKVRPSIHMPRWASRILLEVTEVRVERVQDISGEDAWWEGIGYQGGSGRCVANYADGRVEIDGPMCLSAFRDLWESINGPGSWDANPWVWVVSFKRIEP